MRWPSPLLIAVILMAGCASDDIVIPPPPTQADYECAAQGNLQCVRRLQPDVQDCIIDQVARQLAACTERCASASADGADTDCGAACNRENKTYVGNAATSCRPPEKTIPPP